MPITQPTIDDFQDTTVMRVIRKVVNYLVTLIPKVNEEIANVTDSAGERLDTVEANVEALNKELPTEIRVDYDASTGNFNIDYVKEDGDVLTSNTVVIVSGSTGEVTIVQNTSGISINGTALQSATTAQPGLMTPALVSSLNNVNDTTNDHTTMLNAQAEAITALDDRVDALEQAGGGGEVWEEVDLANIPANWVIGDRIKVAFNLINFSYTHPSNWTTAPSEISNAAGTGGFTAVQEFTLDTSASLRTPIMVEPYSTDIRIYTAGAGALTSFNGDQYSVLFNFYIIMFNGGGIQEKSKTITRATASTYIKKMWRLKK